MYFYHADEQKQNYELRTHHNRNKTRRKCIVPGQGTVTVQVVMPYTRGVSITVKQADPMVRHF